MEVKYGDGDWTPGVGVDVPTWMKDGPEGREYNGGGEV